MQEYYEIIYNMNNLEDLIISKVHESTLNLSSHKAKDS